MPIGLTQPDDLAAPSGACYGWTPDELDRRNAEWNARDEYVQSPEWPMKILTSYRAWKIRCVVANDMTTQNHALLEWEVNESGNGSAFRLCVPHRMPSGQRSAVGRSYMTTAEGVEPTFPSDATRRPPTIDKNKKLHDWIDACLRSRGWR